MSKSELIGSSANALVARLKGLSHTYPDDLDVLLVGPGGQLSDEDAARYGLVAQAVAEKAAPVKPNKLGRGRANKAG